MHYIILTTISSKKGADKIAYELVEKNAAACVNIIKNIDSIYRWQGKIERSGEFLLVVKTNKKNLKKIFDLIKRIHPYDLPEIIALKIEKGERKYLSWIDDSIK